MIITVTIIPISDRNLTVTGAKQIGQFWMDTHFERPRPERALH